MDGPGLRVISAVDQAFEPGLHQRAGAHGAWFNCNKQFAGLQAIVAKSDTGFTQGDDLRMSAGVGISNVTVAAASDYLAAARDDRSYRNFSRFQRSLRGTKGFLHEQFVGADQ